MHILRANLRHFYQRRGLWLVYIVFASVVPIIILGPLVKRVAGEGRFVGLIGLEFLIGALAAVIQTEILTKSFAFCLPGHRQIVKRFIFSVGAATSLPGAMIFLFYPGLPPMWRVLVLCSAFFAGLASYLTGVWVIFHSKQPGFVGLLVFVVLGGILLNLHIVLEQAVAFYPVQVIIVGLLCASAMWTHLNAGDLARLNCLRPWIGFGQVFDREKLRRFQRAQGDVIWRGLKDHPRPWVRDFFIGRMNRRTELGLPRFLWSSLYVSFAIPISRWGSVPVFAPLIAIFLGYAGMRMWAMLAFAPLIVTQALASRPALYSTMLTAGGRAERFVLTLAVAIASAGLLALLIAIIITTSILLTAVMPDITFRGFTLTYHAVGLSAFYAPVVFLPLVCAIQLVFYRRPILMIIVLMTSIYLMVFVGFTFGSKLTRMAGPGTAVALAVGSWLIFTSGVYRAAMHRDLASR